MVLNGFSGKLLHGFLQLFISLYRIIDICHGTLHRTDAISGTVADHLTAALLISSP